MYIRYAENVLEKAAPFGCPVDLWKFFKPWDSQKSSKKREPMSVTYYTLEFWPRVDA